MTKAVFFLIAGEASGDLLGARLMKALKHKLKGEVSFVGVGGPQMQEEGIELLFPHTELMHFGVIEVLRHIPRLLTRIHETARAVIRLHPTALIMIDSPDFCFRVAKLVKKRAHRKIPLIHYVAPTVWAWRPGRARKIARFLDHLLALLPFEPPYFFPHGLACTFVGHPIVESGAGHGSNAIFRTSHKIAAETPLLAVLPGSRISEITRLLPLFRESLEIVKVRHPNLEIVVPVVPHLKERITSEIATWDIPFHIVEGEKEKYDALAASRAALACSGTVALELALGRVPSVIAYKVNALTALIYRRFIRVPYANLVNIMHDKMVVPEFIQNECTAVNLARDVDTLLSNEAARLEQINYLAETAAWLGKGQFIPSERAAETVLSVVRKKTPAPIATILQVLPALETGGVERGTVETTAALTQAGFRALVASQGGPMVYEVEMAGGEHITLPLASKNPITMAANVLRLEHLIKDENVNIVHARSRAPAWSAYVAALRTGVIFVTTFHNVYGAKTKLKRFYNSVMAKGARVIAISHYVADEVMRTYGIEPNILRVIPRGVDFKTFDAEKIVAERIEALRQTWNLTGRAPVILMPGRLTRWKGQSVLIKALALLERRDFVCVIVGGGKHGSYGKDLVREIRQAGLEKNITIFSTCRDMPAAYLLADLVIVPSTRPEGFGRVVIEAQAMGRPVIATNHGGAIETIIDGKTGWLTPPDDASELAKAIEKALALTPMQRHEFAAHATAHIKAHFTTEAMTSKTLAVYRELLHIP